MQTPGGTLLSPTPLVTAVTPSRSRAPPSPELAADGQHIRVVLRIKPPTLDPEAGPACITQLGSNSLSISAPAREHMESDIEPGARTPSRPATPARSRPGSTPGRLSAGTLGWSEADHAESLARTPARRLEDDKRGHAQSRKFVYDAVAGPEETQASVFAQARPLVLSALNGGNACVLAYGQTGSGKTYTMVGEPGALGVIPRSFDLIWDCIDDSPKTEWHVSITCVELYNDGFRDLLATMPTSDTSTPFEIETARRAQNAITLREAKGPRGGPPVAYLTGSDTFRHPVTSRAAMDTLLERALSSRQISATAYNERSSRSHVLITVNLDSRPEGSSTIRCGKLHLVDLAGSEASDASCDPSRAAESRAINTSLNALGDVLQVRPEADASAANVRAIAGRCSGTGFALRVPRNHAARLFFLVVLDEI